MCMYGKALFINHQELNSWQYWHLNPAGSNVASIKSASTQLFQPVICQNSPLLFSKFYELDITLCDLLLIWKLDQNEITQCVRRRDFCKTKIDLNRTWLLEYGSGTEIVLVLPEWINVGRNAFLPVKINDLGLDQHVKHTSGPRRSSWLTTYVIIICQMSINFELQIVPMELRLWSLSCGGVCNMLLVLSIIFAITIYGVVCVQMVFFSLGERIYP